MILCPTAEERGPGIWWTVEVNVGEVHVVPLDDSEVHYDALCACGPALEMQAPNGEFRGIVLTHNAFDRRELRES